MADASPETDAVRRHLGKALQHFEGAILDLVMTDARLKVRLCVAWDKELSLVSANQIALPDAKARFEGLQQNFLEKPSTASHSSAWSSLKNRKPQHLMKLCREIMWIHQRIKDPLEMTATREHFSKTLSDAQA